jgi:hypothetical protein
MLPPSLMLRHNRGSLALTIEALYLTPDILEQLATDHLFDAMSGRTIGVELSRQVTLEGVILLVWTPILLSSCSGDLGFRFKSTTFPIFPLPDKRLPSFSQPRDLGL